MRYRVTEDQAKQAVAIVVNIVEGAGLDEGRPMATQLNLDPSYAEAMLKLYREIKENS